MTTPSEPLLTLRQVRFGFRSGEDVLGPIDLELRPGDFLAVVGPNGAGKSTLLRCMAGLLRPVAGEIRLQGERLNALPIRRRAKEIAFLPQNPPRDAAFTAREIVLMGRFPHRALGLFESPQDLRAAEEAMTMIGIEALADRALCSLSGGEAQLVHLAAAVAQGGRVLLCDEPTAALDLRHQLTILAALRRLAGGDRAVVFVIHDLNFAARFASRLALLRDGRVVATGGAPSVLTVDQVASVYGVKVMALSDGASGWLVPDPSAMEAPA